jgi:hypothetical protein
VNSGSDPSRRVSFRRPLLQGIGVAGAAVFLVVFVVGILAPGGNTGVQSIVDPGGRSGDRLTEGFINGLLAAAALGLAIRLALAGIVMDESGVLFRNYFRSRRLRWQEIERFEGPGRPGFNTGLSARLSDGRSVHSAVYSRALLTPPGFANDVVDHLNRALRAARSRKV